MHLYLELAAGSLWGTLRGSYTVLTYLQSMFADWSTQLCLPGHLERGGAGAPVMVLTASDEMRVFGGALVAVLGGHTWLSVPGLGVIQMHASWPIMEPTPVGRGEALVTAGLLRDYQLEAACALLNAPAGRAIGELATGAGKTHVAVALAALAGGTWLYVVSNQDLAEQTERKATELLPQMLEHTSAPSPVRFISRSWGTVDTSDLWVDGLIADECHAIPAPTRARVVGALGQVGQCQRWLGLSATPIHRTGPANSFTVGMLGPVVFQQGISELVEGGRLAKPVIRDLIVEPGTNLVISRQKH